VPRKGKKVVKWISVRVTPELYEEARQLADEEHRSLNGTLLEALERYLRARRGRQAGQQPKGGEDAR
jgi:hypothetical protein